MVDRETVLLWLVISEYLLAFVDVTVDSPKPVLVRIIESYSNK
jgi:hypothetical protein